MLNKIIIIGNLTRDPELQYTGNQVAHARFTVAVQRDFAGANGERKTDFFNCDAWRATAEFVNKYFHKGSMIAVDGSVQFYDWVDQQGVTRRGTRIVAENVYFTGSKSSENHGENGQHQGYQQSQNGHGGQPQGQSQGQFNQPQNRPQNGYQQQIPGYGSHKDTLSDPEEDLPF